MPAAPADGMVITVESTQIITALTLSPNTGQSIVGVPATLFANQPLSYVYRLSNTTWYPFSVARSAVLQVVNATYSTQVTTTSGTFVTTGLTASITPTSSTSKIFVIANMPMAQPTGGQNVQITLFRNGSNISPNTYLGALQGSGATYGSACIALLDSPATTSSTTYAVYGNCSSGNTAYFNSIPTGSSSSVMTLMEIAA